jgi:hypothetical protein
MLFVQRRVIEPGVVKPGIGQRSLPGTATATAQQTKIIAIKVGEITSNTAASG